MCSNFPSITQVRISRQTRPVKGNLGKHRNLQGVGCRYRQNGRQNLAPCARQSRAESVKWVELAGAVRSQLRGAGAIKPSVGLEAWA